MKADLKLEKLTLELLRKCPNRCVHCSTASSPVATDMLSFEDVQRIVNQAIPLGLRKVILSGGEPLIYPNLIPLVELLRNHDLEVVIYTSGSVLADGASVPVPEQLIRKLLHCQCVFHLSLHSHLELIHDKFMDTAGSWGRAVEFLGAVSSFARLDIHTVVTRMNFTHLRDLTRFLCAYPIKQLRFLRFVPQGRAKLYVDELELGESEWETVGRQIDELKQEQIPFPVKLGAHLPASIGHSSECSLDRGKLLIEPNGAVSVCPALKGCRTVLNAPSARSQSLAQIVGSEWRQTVADLKSSSVSSCPAQILYAISGTMHSREASSEEALLNGFKQAVE